jgi:hypothetical protein
MSATYSSAIASLVDNEEEKHCLISALKSGGFYSVINSHLDDKYDFSNQDEYDKFKKEFQKQCLFWNYYGPRPLWDALRKVFPFMASKILQLRRDYGVSGLSDVLTKIEASVFIDRVVVWCGRNDIPVIPVHDAVYVPESVSMLVMDQLRDACVQVLGYVPKLKLQG